MSLMSRREEQTDGRYNDAQDTPGVARDGVPDTASDTSFGWSVLYKKLRDPIEAKIRDYKEDIDGFLVFAGLFSAVLTSLLAESFQHLQQDPQDVVATHAGSLLTQNFTVSAQYLNSTQTTPPSVPFHVPSWAIRVNVLWFSSLILSLGTASLGILVKGWLRAYLALDYTSDKDKVQALQFRRPWLEVWMVFDIAAALPLLLQLSLALFFIGLWIFTAAIHSSVRNITIPLVVAWAASLFFTIVAPFIWPHCPYKIAFATKALQVLRFHVLRLTRTSRLWNNRAPRPVEKENNIGTAVASTEAAKANTMEATPKVEKADTGWEEENLESQKTNTERSKPGEGANLEAQRYRAAFAGIRAMQVLRAFIRSILQQPRNEEGKANPDVEKVENAEEANLEGAKAIATKEEKPEADGANSEAKATEPGEEVDLESERTNPGAMVKMKADEIQWTTYSTEEKLLNDQRKDVDILLSVDYSMKDDHLLPAMREILRHPSTTLRDVVNFARQAIGRRLDRPPPSAPLNDLWDLRVIAMPGLSDTAWISISGALSDALIREMEDHRLTPFLDKKVTDPVIDAAIILLSPTNFHLPRGATRALQKFFSASTHSRDSTYPGSLLGNRLGTTFRERRGEDNRYLSHALLSSTSTHLFAPYLPCIMEAYKRCIFPKAVDNDKSFLSLIQSQDLVVSTSGDARVRQTERDFENLYHTLLKILDGAAASRGVSSPETDDPLFIVFKFGPSATENAKDFKLTSELCKSMCLDDKDVGVCLSFFASLHDDTRVLDRRENIFVDAFRNATLHEQRVMIGHWTAYCKSHLATPRTESQSSRPHLSPVDFIRLSRLLLTVQMTVFRDQGDMAQERYNALTKEWYELSDALSQSLGKYKTETRKNIRPVHPDRARSTLKTWNNEDTTIPYFKELFDILLPEIAQEKTTTESDLLLIYPMNLIVSLRAFNPPYPNPSEFDTRLAHRRQRLIRGAVASVAKHDAVAEDYLLSSLDAIDEDVLVHTLCELEESSARAEGARYLISRLIWLITNDQLSRDELRIPATIKRRGRISPKAQQRLSEFVFCRPDDARRDYWISEAISVVLCFLDHSATYANAHTIPPFDIATPFIHGLKLTDRLLGIWPAERTSDTSNPPSLRWLLEIYKMSFDEALIFTDRDIIDMFQGNALVFATTARVATLLDLRSLLQNLVPRYVTESESSRADEGWLAGARILLEAAGGSFLEEETGTSLCTAMATCGSVPKVALYWKLFAAHGVGTRVSEAKEKFFLDTWREISGDAATSFLSTSMKVFEAAAQVPINLMSPHFPRPLLRSRLLHRFRQYRYPPPLNLVKVVHLILSLIDRNNIVFDKWQEFWETLSRYAKRWAAHGKRWVETEKIFEDCRKMKHEMDPSQPGNQRYDRILDNSFMELFTTLEAFGGEAPAGNDSAGGGEEIAQQQGEALPHEGASDAEVNL